MNTAKLYCNTSSSLRSTRHQPSNYSFYLLKDLSSVAKYLYIELRRIAGIKDYLSYSAKDLTEIIGRSQKQTRRLLHGLEQCGLIEIWLQATLNRNILFQTSILGIPWTEKSKLLRIRVLRLRKWLEGNGVSLCQSQEQNTEIQVKTSEKQLQGLYLSQIPMQIRLRLRSKPRLRRNQYGLIWFVRSWT